MKFEYFKPNPRYDDWRVKVDGRTLGSVWLLKDTGEYMMSVITTERYPTLDAAFKEARKQIKRVLTAA
jgi:hypothetical protein